MAQIIRSAKSGSDWTGAELLAYNISITPTSPAEFFTSYADPSLDHLDPGILTSATTADPSLSDDAAGYLRYLSLATRGEQEGAIVDFARATLEFLGFEERRTTVASRYNIPLYICGETRDAQTSACILYDPTTVLLVVVQDLRFFDVSNTNAEAHVVAAAIAAFQFNNTKRAASGKSILDAMTIPCITMLGTIPTFYLIPVTKELSDSVVTAEYPTSPTRVLKCVTVATRQALRSDGMADPEYRELALKRLLAFKGLARSYWREYAPW
ncbi:hypothetical protein BKA70DRAFT_1098691 [Coprinopsis sp. MPI-PUGE-AT-0042]|nr:hypothetical protein BKA70DRAFT_1098691 [Coprinopsis sp. MPI-PUGE-AT-0042]